MTAVSSLIFQNNNNYTSWNLQSRLPRNAVLHPLAPGNTLGRVSPAKISTKAARKHTCALWRLRHKHTWELLWSWNLRGNVVARRTSYVSHCHSATGIKSYWRFCLDIPMTLDGVEIITNSSASHFSLQKLDTRLKLIGEATRKCGGVYMYSNVSGLLPDLAGHFLVFIF